MSPSPASTHQDRKEAIRFHAQVLAQIRHWQRVGLLTATTRDNLMAYERSQIAALTGTPTPAPKPTPAVTPTPKTDQGAGFTPARQGGPKPSPAPTRRAPPTIPAAKPPPLPRKPSIPTLPLPARPRSEGHSMLAVVGHFLRERTWWLVGAALTVIGSFFVAGTVWSDLGDAPRLAMVLVGLGLYALAFARLGHRLARQPGGERAGGWLIGVSVAMAPVLGMAAGSGWAMGGMNAAAFTLPALTAVALFLAWRLPRDLPRLLPRSGRFFRWLYLSLCAGIGLLPLASSPAFLLLPTLGVALGTWWAMTRWHRLPPTAGLLLLHPLAFHVYLAPHGWSGAYAPALAVAALTVLYLDAALGRWRGVHAMSLRGLRGVLALGLAGLALVLLAPGFVPLPSGPETALTGLLLVPFFLGAALTWRRPVLIFGSAVAALLFTLALPDLFWAMVEPFLLLAGQALGYSDEPLPLAWYSTTLLPYVLVCRLAAGGLRRSGWRQAEALSAHLWRWTFGLSLLLVIIAHTRGSDLRPALLALPLHGALWLREHRVRSLVSGTLPWIGLLVWTIDLLHYTGASLELRLLVGTTSVLALIPAGRWLARRMGEHDILAGARVVAVPAALAMPLLLGGWELPELTLVLAGASTWLVSLGLRPLGASPTQNLYQLETLLAVTGQALLVAGAMGWTISLEPGFLTWAVGLEAVAIAAVILAWWLPRHRPMVGGTSIALHVWAHALVLLAVFMLAHLHGLERSLMKLPIALLLAWWLSRTHWRVYGAVLVAGVAESVLRRLWMWGGLEPANLAVIAMGLAWLPALVLIASKRSEPRFAIHWIHRSLGQPAAWLGAVSATVAFPMLMATWPATVETQVAAAALVGMLLLASRLHEETRRWLEVAAWVAAVFLAARWALSGPAVYLLPWLEIGSIGLGLLALWRPSLERRGVTVLAIGAAVLVAAIHGPLDQVQLLVAASAGLSLLALRAPRGWGEVALLAWVITGLTLLERALAPGIGWHLVAMTVAAGALWCLGRSRERLPRLGACAWHAGLGLAAVCLGGWALWTAALAGDGALELWPLGLVAATALVWAYRQSVAARLVAPWAIAACLLAIEAPYLAYPLAWLVLAAATWLLSQRRPSDRWVTRIISAAVVLGLAWVAEERHEMRPMVAFALPLVGLLLTHTGLRTRWAWAGLAAGLVTAAALDPVEPIAVALRSALAFTLVSTLVHLRPQRGRVPGQALLWAVGSLGLGLCTGAWGLTALALAAGAFLLVRIQRGEPTGGPRLLEEPAGWMLLAGGVALRLLDQGGTAEWLFLAAAIPALAWSLPRPWLFLASLPLLAWLPGEVLGVDFCIAWPTVLGILALTAIGLRRQVPGGDKATWLLLGLGTLTAGLTLLDRGTVDYSLVAGLLALGWWLKGQRAGALLQVLVAGMLLTWTELGPETAAPALVALGIALGARRLEARWLEVVALVTLIPACLLEGGALPGVEPSGWQQAVLALVCALSLWRTLADTEPTRWYRTLAWGAGLYSVLRIWGPLADIPPNLELPLLVFLGLAFECAALAWERTRGEAWVAPLRAATVGVAVAAMLASVTLDGVTSIGVALAGCLFCLRWVLRPRWPELVVGVILLDVATMMLFHRVQWTEPLAYVGPTGLSLLVLAQLLRQSMDPRVRTLLRYAGASCIYLCTWGQAVLDPGWTLGLLLMALGGIAAGSLLRVRAFVYLGAGFMASALLTELLRFGLNHSGFWAFYLTSIGLTILGGMVALTVFRPQLAAMRARWRRGSGRASMGLCHWNTPAARLGNPAGNIPQDM